jgi:hypothetical protein
MLLRYLLVDLSIDMWLEILTVIMYRVLYYSLILVKILLYRQFIESSQCKIGKSFRTLYNCYME